MPTQIGCAHILIVPQFARIAADNQLACFKHIAPIRHRKTHTGILLHQQNRCAHAPDFFDDVEHFGHNHRCKAQ